MANCRSIDSLVAAYVDGELSSADRLQVDEHLRRCPPCHSRVVAESAIRGLVHAQRKALSSDRAPARLRTRCASLARMDAEVRPATSALTETRARWQRRAWLALAASLVIGAGGVLAYRVTERSIVLMAAELAADHVKCFTTNRLLGTHDDPANVERTMLASFNWPLHLPQQLTRAGFELVGARRCLYGEGKAAHIMYRQQGRAVSVFMLPSSKRSEQIVEVLGHEAAIWSVGDRTFVMVTRGSRAEVQEAAAIVKASFQ